MGVALNMQLVALGGFLIAALMVLGFAYWGVRKHRAHLSPTAFRQLYIQNLTRISAWSVGSYVVWFIVISPLLAARGIHIPRASR